MRTTSDLLSWVTWASSTSSLHSAVSLDVVAHNSHIERETQSTSHGKQDSAAAAVQPVLYSVDTVYNSFVLYTFKHTDKQLP